jgi:hypothetical protein
MSKGFAVNWDRVKMAAPHSDPQTREVALEGLRQGFQARVVNLYSTVSTAGEPNPDERFKKGFDLAVDAYERFHKYISSHTP